MSRLKTGLLRLLPMLCLALLTVFLSFFMCSEMIRKEEADGWELLANTSESTALTIQKRFEGNMVLLDRVADALHMEALLDRDESVLDYLNRLQTTTMFDRIDILYPDGRLLCQDGSVIHFEGMLTYDELLAASPFMTQRTTDPRSGHEVLYYFTAIHSHAQVEGLLIGTIDCTMLRAQFPLNIYGGKARLYLLDRTDGHFIMCDWDGSFDHIDQINQYEMLPGYDAEDLIQAALAGDTGRVAYRSLPSGVLKYMYVIPVPGFPWQLCITVEESVAFAKVFELRDLLVVVCVVLALLVLLYLAVNAYFIFRSVNSEAKAHAAEMERVGNEAKSRFLATVSHDIRTPLNGILGMLDLLKRREYSPEQLQTSLHKIEVSARYLMTLANDVLDLNEIENTKVVLAHERVNLHVLMEDLESLVLTRAQEHAVHCFFNASAIRNPCVMASSVHLQRLLINLITNAIKYNRRDGSVWVTAEEFRLAQHRSLYRFTVRDNGQGMSEEFQRDMFKAFEQEHGGARTIHQGHGLGLSIVKHLVDAMQGTIDVKSEKGVGSAFTVILTFDHADSSDDPAVSAPLVPDITGMRLLLAEDNELNMEIAVALLSDAGAEVTAVCNGREAVDAFAASDLFVCDAILMDVMMPEMDGLEATRAIRTLERPDAALVPIIAMTASTFIEDIRRCKEAGMDHHMSKPLNLDTLLQLLTQERAKYSLRQKEVK